jgi:hypothetical protein
MGFLPTFRGKRSTINGFLGECIGEYVENVSFRIKNSLPFNCRTIALNSKKTTGTTEEWSLRCISLILIELDGMGLSGCFYWSVCDPIEIQREFSNESK